MRVCCVELNIAARLIGFYGLVVGAVVMVEMSTEMGRLDCSIETITASLSGHEVAAEEEISGGAAMSAWLLGLSLDEFGSRMRHTLHPPRAMPPHVHVHSSPGDPPHMHIHKPPVPEVPERNLTQDLSNMEAEKQIYLGFLMFAVVYASSSALLVFGSIVETKWAAVPWLVAHLGTVSAQTAGLVVQVTAAISVAPQNDQLAPGHPDGAHVEDHAGNSSPGALILSVVNMMFLVYVWLVVIVTTRSWGARTLRMSTKPSPGDESFQLSTIASAYDSY